MSTQRNKKTPGEKNATAPLMSWDIFMQSYHSLKALADDMQQLNNLSRKYAWHPTGWNLEEKLLQQRKTVLVTNSAQQIIFASHHIEQMTGYSVEEMVGSTPKMLQGQDTDPFVRAVIRQALHEVKPFHVSILNYKKNKDTYLCDLEAFPIFNRQEKLTHFIAFETASQ